MCRGCESALPKRGRRRVSAGAGVHGPLGMRGSPLPPGLCLFSISGVTLTDCALLSSYHSSTLSFVGCETTYLISSELCLKAEQSASRGKASFVNVL